MGGKEKGEIKILDSSGKKLKLVFTPDGQRNIYDAYQKFSMQQDFETCEPQPQWKLDFLKAHPQCAICLISLPETFEVRGDTWIVKLSKGLRIRVCTPCSGRFRGAGISGNCRSLDIDIHEKGSPLQLELQKDLEKNGFKTLQHLVRSVTSILLVGDFISKRFLSNLVEKSQGQLTDSQLEQYEGDLSIEVLDDLEGWAAEKPLLFPENEHDSMILRKIRVSLVSRLFIDPDFKNLRREILRDTPTLPERLSKYMQPKTEHSCTKISLALPFSEEALKDTSDMAVSFISVATYNGNDVIHDEMIQLKTALSQDTYESLKTALEGWIKSHDDPSGTLVIEYTDEWV